MYNVDLKCSKIFYVTLHRFSKKFDLISFRNNKPINNINRLINIINKNINNFDSKKWIKNLISVDIPADVSDVVSLGNKFNVQKKLVKSDMVSAVKELEFRRIRADVSNDLKDEIRE